MISQKKVRLMALSAISQKRGIERELFAARVTKEKYSILKSVQTGFYTAAALIFIKILQSFIDGNWEILIEQIRTVGIYTFFLNFHPVMDILVIAAYMVFAYWWYGREYGRFSEEARKELNRRELIRKLDESRRIG